MLCCIMNKMTPAPPWNTIQVINIMTFEIVIVMKMNSNTLPSSSSILTPVAADTTAIFVVTL